MSGACAAQRLSADGRTAEVATSTDGRHAERHADEEAVSAGTRAGAAALSTCAAQRLSADSRTAEEAAVPAAAADA